jgi:hypothetical protein
MPMLRLLSTSLLASAAAVTAAQTPATSLNLSPTPGTLTWSTPQLFSTNSLPSTLTSQAPETLHSDPSTSSNLLDLPPGTKLSAEQQKNLDKALAGLKELEKSSKVAGNNQPCYKLRVYGFTPHDLKSPHPHASTETDCTPATSAHLKVLQLPATNAK